MEIAPARCSSSTRDGGVRLRTSEGPKGRPSPTRAGNSRPDDDPHIDPADRRGARRRRRKRSARRRRAVAAAAPSAAGSRALDRLAVTATGITIAVAVAVAVCDAVAVRDAVVVTVAGQAALPAFPIRVDRARVGVVPGGTATVGVSGGSGPLAAQASFDGAVVRYDAATRTLFITGRAFGRGTVTLSDAAGDTASVAVLVAPPAGVVPTDATAELAGNVNAQFAVARVRATIAQAAQMQPGATIDVGGVTAGDLRPGQGLEARANVVVHGNDNYVDQSGTTYVHVRVDALPQLDPTVLFYSDDPERLGALDDGVLFRGTIDATRPARAYIYHVSDSPNRRLYLALQPTTSDGARAGARRRRRTVRCVRVRRSPGDASLPARARVARELRRAAAAGGAVSDAAGRGSDASRLADQRDLRPPRARRCAGERARRRREQRRRSGVTAGAAGARERHALPARRVLAGERSAAGAVVHRGRARAGAVRGRRAVLCEQSTRVSEPAARRRRGGRSARAARRRLRRAAQRRAAVREPDAFAAERLYYEQPGATGGGSPRRSGSPATPRRRKCAASAIRRTGIW